MIIRKISHNIFILLICLCISLSGAIIEKYCCDDMDINEPVSRKIPQVQMCCVENQNIDILYDSDLKQCCSDNNVSGHNGPECKCNLNNSDTQGNNTVVSALTIVRLKTFHAISILPLTETSSFVIPSYPDLQYGSVYSAPIYLQNLSILI